MAAFLRDTLRGFFARGAFKVLCLGPGFYPFPPQKILDHISLFIDAITGIYLRSPALPVFDFSNDFVRLFDVESSVRLNDLFRVGMRPVHDNMKMTVSRILVQGIERLMFGKPHSPEKEIDRFIHLFTGRLLVFLP